MLSCIAGRICRATQKAKSHLKRALTDPTIFDGIGNAYSDEILHRARLSPFVLTGRIEEDEIRRLLPSQSRHADRMDQAVTAGGGGPVAGEGDRLSRRAWRSTDAMEALPRLRDPGPADQVRRQRDQLLPDVPDRGTAPGRPGVESLVKGGLAALAGGAGRAHQGEALSSSRGRTRTCDPLINSQLLYQLSYSGRAKRIKPPTYRGKLPQNALPIPRNGFCDNPLVLL